MSTEVATLGPLHLLATTPEGMAVAQTRMSKWACDRVGLAAADVEEARRTLDAARGAGFGNLGRFASRLRREKARLRFYEKVAAALAAGYYLVPPFPVQVFAIRTNRSYARPATSSYRHTFEQPPTATEAGKGEWKSPLPDVQTRRVSVTGKDGQTTAMTEYYPWKLVAPDFPFALVKPELIEATKEAMDHMLFDSLGVVAGQSDPIILGQIKQPGSSRWGPSLNFFIAWWMDTREMP